MASAGYVQPAQTYTYVDTFAEDTVGGVSNVWNSSRTFNTAMQLPNCQMTVTGQVSLKANININSTNDRFTMVLYPVLADVMRANMPRMTSQSLGGENAAIVSQVNQWPVSLIDATAASFLESPLVTVPMYSMSWAPPMTQNYYASGNNQLTLSREKYESGTSGTILALPANFYSSWPQSNDNNSTIDTALGLAHKEPGSPFWNSAVVYNSSLFSAVSCLPTQNTAQVTDGNTYPLTNAPTLTVVNGTNVNPFQPYVIPWFLDPTAAVGPTTTPYSAVHNNAPHLNLLNWWGNLGPWLSVVSATENVTVDWYVFTWTNVGPYCSTQMFTLGPVAPGSSPAFNGQNFWIDNTNFSINTAPVGYQPPALLTPPNNLASFTGSSVPYIYGMNWHMNACISTYGLINTSGIVNNNTSVIWSTSNLYPFPGTEVLQEVVRLPLVEGGFGGTNYTVLASNGPATFPQAFFYQEKYYNEVLTPVSLAYNLAPNASLSYCSASNFTLDHHLSYVTSICGIVDTGTTNLGQGAQTSPYIFPINNSEDSALNGSMLKPGSTLQPQVGHCYLPFLSASQASMWAAGWPIPPHQLYKNAPASKTGARDQSWFVPSAYESSRDWMQDGMCQLAVGAQAIFSTCDWPKNTWAAWGTRPLFFNRGPNQTGETENFLTSNNNSGTPLSPQQLAWVPMSASNYLCWFPEGFIIEARSVITGHMSFFMQNTPARPQVYDQPLSWTSTITIPHGSYSATELAYLMSNALQTPGPDGNLPALKFVDLTQMAGLWTTTDYSDDVTVWNQGPGSTRPANRTGPAPTPGKGRLFKAFAGPRGYVQLGASELNWTLNSQGLLQLTQGFTPFLPDPTTTSSLQGGQASVFALPSSYSRYANDPMMNGSWGQQLNSGVYGPVDASFAPNSYLLSAPAGGPYGAGVANTQAVPFLSYQNTQSANVDLNVSGLTAQYRDWESVYENYQVNDTKPSNLAIMPPLDASSWDSTYTSPLQLWQSQFNLNLALCVERKAAAYPVLNPYGYANVPGLTGVQIGSLCDGSTIEQEFWRTVGFDPVQLQDMWTPQVSYVRPIEGLYYQPLTSQWGFDPEAFVASNETPWLAFRAPNWYLNSAQVSVAECLAQLPVYGTSFNTANTTWGSRDWAQTVVDKNTATAPVSISSQYANSYVTNLPMLANLRMTGLMPIGTNIPGFTWQHLGGITFPANYTENFAGWSSIYPTGIQYTAVTPNNPALQADVTYYPAMGWFVADPLIKTVQTVHSITPGSTHDVWPNHDAIPIFLRYAVNPYNMHGSLPQPTLHSGTPTVGTFDNFYEAGYPLDASATSVINSFFRFDNDNTQLPNLSHLQNGYYATGYASGTIQSLEQIPANDVPMGVYGANCVHRTNPAWPNSYWADTPLMQVAVTYVSSTLVSNNYTIGNWYFTNMNLLYGSAVFVTTYDNFWTSSTLPGPQIWSSGGWGYDTTQSLPTRQLSWVELYAGMQLTFSQYVSSTPPAGVSSSVIRTFSRMLMYALDALTLIVPKYATPITNFTVRPAIVSWLPYLQFYHDNYAYMPNVATGGYPFGTNGFGDIYGMLDSCWSNWQASPVGQGGSPYLGLTAWSRWYSMLSNFPRAGRVCCDQIAPYTFNHTPCTAYRSFGTGLVTKEEASQSINTNFPWQTAPYLSGAAPFAAELSMVGQESDSFAVVTNYTITSGNQGCLAYTFGNSVAAEPGNDYGSAGAVQLNPMPINVQSDVDPSDPVQYVTNLSRFLTANTVPVVNQDFVTNGVLLMRIIGMNFTTTCTAYIKGQASQSFIPMTFSTASDIIQTLAFESPDTWNVPCQTIDALTFQFYDLNLQPATFLTNVRLILTFTPTGQLTQLDTAMTTQSSLLQVQSNTQPQITQTGPNATAVQPRATVDIANAARNMGVKRLKRN